MRGLGGSSSRVYAIGELPWRYRLARLIGHQHWIPRGQDRLIRLLHNPRRSVPITFETEFFGMTYRGTLEQYLDAQVLFYGSYERPILALLQDIAESLPRPVTYCDVGANLGHHALFMSKHANQVFAFEPFPPLQDAIKQKLKQNRVCNVTVVPVGLGDRDEDLIYHPGLGTNSGGGTFLPETIGAASEGCPLRVRHAGRLLDELGAGRLDIVKLDVEGFEVPVLRGLAQRLLSDRPIVIMELGERTKRELAGEVELAKLFYPNAKMFRVSGREGRSKYGLASLEYNSPKEVNIVVFPDEKLAFLRERVAESHVCNKSVHSTAYEAGKKGAMRVATATTWLKRGAGTETRSFADAITSKGVEI